MTSAVPQDNIAAGAPPAARPASRPTLPALTSCRFLAAMAVVVFHVCTFAQAPSRVIDFVGHGTAGVSFFFVLSGFVLTYNYRDRFARGIHAAGLAEFARARWARVWPMHAAALLFATPVALYRLLRHPEIAGPFEAALSWLANLLLVQVYVPTELFQQQWNGPSWSIATEAAFYLVFPFFIFAVVARLRTRGSILLMIAACLALQALLVGLRWDSIVRGTPADAPHELLEQRLDFLLYRLPWFRVWEFLVGCGVAAIYLDHPPAFLRRRGGRDALLLLGLGLTLAIVAACAAVVPGRPPVSTNFVFFTLPFAMIVLALASGTTFLSPLLEAPLLILLGEASYSLYLIHAKPVQIVCYACPPKYLPIAAPLLLAGCVALSLPCYWWIETPARKWLRGTGKAKPAATA
ncbi:MAG: acyltransferase [Planctomycetota bacterium]|nr:acyltransferase [Planctomycetota bacterium]